MNQGILDLLKEAATDSQLAKNLRECRTSEDAYEIAAERGCGFTKQEFVDAMKDIMKVIAESNQDRISKADLTSVSNGSSTSTIVSAVSTYTGAAAAGAAAAAA